MEPKVYFLLVSIQTFRAQFVSLGWRKEGPPPVRFSVRWYAEYCNYNCVKNGCLLTILFNGLEIGRKVGFQMIYGSDFKSSTCRRVLIQSENRTAFVNEGFRRNHPQAALTWQNYSTFWMPISIKGEQRDLALQVRFSKAEWAMAIKSVQSWSKFESLKPAIGVENQVFHASEMRMIVC